MKKGLTEFVFILDRSGSMGGLESDTIGGFNGMIHKQKEQDGEAHVTTVLFDDQIEVIHQGVNLSEVRDLTSEDYYVRGCTALLDAVGSSIHDMKEKQARLPEEEKAEKIIFVITTDGHENASQDYNIKKVKKMIEKRQKKGWQFVFMGANMDAVSEAGRIGIDKRNAVTYKNDSEGVALNYSCVGNFLASARCAEPQEACYADVYFEDVREHAKEKRKRA